MTQVSDTVTVLSAPAGGRVGASGVDLTTTLGRAVFPNPVFTASGCAAAGAELAPYLDVAALGGIVTKSIMLEARSGRATPRMAETPSGMLNSIGLQGPGIDSFLAKDLPWLVAHGARAVVSIAGGTADEFAKLAARLRGAEGLAMLEVNISCPNVESRGEVFACHPETAAQVITGVRRAFGTSVPIFAKLTPDVTDIVEVAGAVVEAGADGLSMINTLLGLAIDPDTLRPILGGITGGLSGPAIRPVALRCVYQVHAAMPEVPILGMGGIRSGADALAFLAAGASAVSVGTATFGDPGAPARVLLELEAALARRGFTSAADAIGVAHAPPEHSERAISALPEGPDPLGDEPLGDEPLTDEPLTDEALTDEAPVVDPSVNP